MMSKIEDNYVVLRLSGKVMSFNSLGSRLDQAPSIFVDLLDVIYTEFQSAGSSYDPPHRLLKNGVEVMSNLKDLAYKWGKDRQALREAANVWLRNKHTPDVLRDQRFGYNPPGIDVFTITKNRENF